MPMKDELAIRNFAGLNVKDAADKVANNEFTLLQNVWQPSKGVYARRYGTTVDRSSIPLCSRISGVWRHYSSNQEYINLYHCVPDSTVFPDNTVDLVLTEIASGAGNLGDGNVCTYKVCYSWIGCGIEQTYNSRTRAGFPAGGSFPLHAHANPGHQAINMTGATNLIRVTIPAFPTGVRGANIFAARDNKISGPNAETFTDMTYMGTVTTSAGTLDIKAFTGPVAANLDAVDATYIAGVIFGSTVAGGTLKPGNYFVSMGWVTDPNIKEGAEGTTGRRTPVLGISQVSVSGSQNSITIPGLDAMSTNGAKSVYVFCGTQDPRIQPNSVVGIQNLADTSFIIKSIPQTNAQSTPIMNNAEIAPLFWHMVNDGNIGGSNYDVTKKFQGRYGFLMGLNGMFTGTIPVGSAIYEIFPSRTNQYNVLALISTSVFPGDAIQADLHNYAPQPKTQNDLNKYVSDASFSQPFTWSDKITDPVFCHHLGISYFANGGDIPWQTDGYTLGQLSVAKTGTQTTLPPIPRFIFAYQNALIVSGSRCGNLVYGSNANAPQNWATGGTGSLLRFVTIGDAVGSGVSAFGLFTPATDSTNSPNSFMISFKKSGIWMINTIPDPASSSIIGGTGSIGQIPATQIQVSGRVGCVAYRTVCQTSSGTAFLGSDANVYLVNRVSEPIKIGTKVQNFLKHLVGKDDNMQRCTAVFHDGHYKLSYPSAYAITQSPVVNDSELWADFRNEEGDRITWNGPHIGRNIGPQVVFVGEGDDLTRFAADSASVRSLVVDDKSVLTDIGSNIAIKIKSKIYRMGTESHLKRIWGAFLDIYMDFSFTNNILFEVFADDDYQQARRLFSSGGAIWDTSLWDEATSTYGDAEWFGRDFLFGRTNLNGRTIQWQVSSSDASPFILASVTPIVRPERRRIIA